VITTGAARVHQPDTPAKFALFLRRLVASNDLSDELAKEALKTFAAGETNLSRASEFTAWFNSWPKEPAPSKTVKQGPNRNGAAKTSGFFILPQIPTVRRVELRPEPILAFSYNVPEDLLVRAKLTIHRAPPADRDAEKPAPVERELSFRAFALDPKAGDTVYTKTFDFPEMGREVLSIEMTLITEPAKKGAEKVDGEKAEARPETRNFRFVREVVLFRLTGDNKLVQIVSDNVRVQHLWELYRGQMAPCPPNPVAPQPAPEGPKNPPGGAV
jgi:hypothetical protein